MTELLQRPSALQINGWTGEIAPRDELPSRTKWAQQEKLSGRSQWLAPAAPVDERDWRHPSVGWGVVLPDPASGDAAAKAVGEDAPDPIKKLLSARPGSPVLRYRADLGERYLRRYYKHRPPQDLSVQAPHPGMGEGQVPQYLLICGTPEEIPWPVQYALNMSTFVGRLDLGFGSVEKKEREKKSLENYVNALIDDWAGQTCAPAKPVVWSTDHGPNDITRLMSQVIAGNVWKKFKDDPDLAGAVRIDKDQATGAALAAALAEHTPGLVVTTSHGMTGPLYDKAALVAHLGELVDAQFQPIGASQLGGWQPGGAVWYAHACCAAGSDKESRYKGMLPDSSSIATLLNGVATAAGAVVAPFPNALLGLERPIRAFVGHVEPTFDWTLRDPNNKQVVTHVLQEALYNRLFQQDRRTPIGFALQDVYKEAGQFYGAWQDAVKGIDKNEPGMRDWALYRQLVALDRQTMVILGDPTVSLPLLSH